MKTPAKINKRKKNNYTTPVAIVAMLAISLVVVYFNHNNISQLFTVTTDFSNHEYNEQSLIENEVNLDPATEQQVEDGQSIKEKSLDPEQEKNTNTTDLTLTATQTDSLVRIGSIISQITNEGICKLTLTNQNKSVSLTSEVQSLSSYSTCKGFDIEKSKLSPGTWNINLTYSSNEYQAQSSSEITIE